MITASDFDFVIALGCFLLTCGIIGMAGTGLALWVEFRREERRDRR